MLVQFEDKNYKMLDFGYDDKVKTLSDVIRKFYKKNDKYKIEMFLRLEKDTTYFAIYDDTIKGSKPLLLKRLTIEELLANCTH